MADLTPQALAALNTDQLLDLAVATKAQAKRLAGDLTLIQDELTGRMEAGELDPSFDHDDWGFSWSEGKRSWQYPSAVTAIETKLKTARQVAQANGTATAATGAPFWTIREPRG